jgi:hypothetical protein
MQEDILCWTIKGEKGRKYFLNFTHFNEYLKIRNKSIFAKLDYIFFKLTTRPKLGVNSLFTWYQQEEKPSPRYVSRELQLKKAYQNLRSEVDINLNNYPLVFILTPTQFTLPFSSLNFPPYGI